MTNLQTQREEGTREIPDQINFTLKVAATNLPLHDDNFKIKLSLDLIPDFNEKLESIKPNFNANIVRDILKYVADDAILKVIEHLYFDCDIKYGKNGYKPESYERVKAIYEERKVIKEEEKKQGNPDSTKHLDHKEEEVIKMVREYFLNERRRRDPREENVTRIRFERLSPGTLGYDYSTIVNGDKKPSAL